MRAKEKQAPFRRWWAETACFKEEARRLVGNALTRCLEPLDRIQWPAS